LEEFYKKPDKFEGFLFNGGSDNAQIIIDWIQSGKKWSAIYREKSYHNDHRVIHEAILIGNNFIVAEVGAWILKDSNGDFQKIEPYELQEKFIPASRFNGSLSEDTLEKAADALYQAGVPEDLSWTAIQKLLDAGFLIRERTK
jgi:hypothetical protein